MPVGAFNFFEPQYPIVLTTCILSQLGRRGSGKNLKRIKSLQIKSNVAIKYVANGHNVWLSGIYGNRQIYIRNHLLSSLDVIMSARYGMLTCRWKGGG